MILECWAVIKDIIDIEIVKNYKNKWHNTTFIAVLCKIKRFECGVKLVLF